MTLRAICTAAAIGVACLGIAAPAQTSRWAKPDEPEAKRMIDMERQWAESGCTHNGIEKTILAEDFHGIAPDGSEYSKKDMVAESESDTTSERACTMFAVKVHYFGENMAILYGSESAVHIEKDGHEHTVKLTWVDTWLRRDGKWQIVAAEDLPTEIKE